MLIQEPLYEMRTQALTDEMDDRKRIVGPQQIAGDGRAYPGPATRGGQRASGHRLPVVRVDDPFLRGGVHIPDSRGQARQPVGGVVAVTVRDEQKPGTVGSERQRRVVSGNIRRRAGNQRADYGGSA